METSGKFLVFGERQNQSNHIRTKRSEIHEVASRIVTSSQSRRTGGDEAVALSAMGVSAISKTECTKTRVDLRIYHHACLSAEFSSAAPKGLLPLSFMSDNLISMVRTWQLASTMP